MFKYSTISTILHRKREVGPGVTLHNTSSWFQNGPISARAASDTN